MTPEPDADSGVTITGRRNCLPYCLALNRSLSKAMLERGGCGRSCPSVCVGYAWVEEGYTKVWGQVGTSGQVLFETNIAAQGASTPARPMPLFSRWALRYPTLC